MRNYTELSPADKELVLAHIKLYMDYKDVAEKCNVNRRVVSRIAIENGIRKRKFSNRTMKSREVESGYKPQGEFRTVGFADPIAMSPNVVEVEVDQTIHVPGESMLSWFKSLFSKFGDFLFGPSSKVNSTKRERSKNMEHMLNADQIFKIVFSYKTGTPAGEVGWPTLKLSSTREGHSQQVRRLAEYILSNRKEYAGIVHPTIWFYKRAFHQFGFYDVYDASCTTCRNFMSMEEACNFMFDNKYINKHDYLNKNLF